MKKVFMMTALITVMMVASVCSAIGRNEFSLGGIYLNMPYNSVIKMYGQPTSHPGGWAQLVTDCIKYGNDVEIGFCNKKVRYVTVTANNGWKTPSGVYVGMSINDVIRKYGSNYTTENQSVRFDHQREHLLTSLEGTQYIWTQVRNDVYTYDPGDTSYRVSVVVSNGVVNAIVLDQITPEY